MVFKKTAPLCIINGDKKQHSKLERKIYFCLNRYNNSRPISGDSEKMSINYFSCKTLDLESHLTSQSPARLLIDYFLKTYNFEQLYERLGTFKLHDMGCNKGTYYLMFKELIGKYLSSYSGYDIDTFEEWERLEANKNVTFRKFDGHSFYDTLTDSNNFFLSITAAEHIKNDLSYFEAVRKTIEKDKRPSIQMHFLPSPSCLELYGTHGYRQYTVRSINKIIKKYNSEHSCHLIKLGNAHLMKFIKNIFQENMGI